MSNFYRTILLILIFFNGIYSFLAQGVGERDQTLFQELIEQGQGYWIDGKYDRAYAYFLQAQQEALRIEDRASWARATYSVGKYFSRTMDLSQAEIYLDSVIGLSDQIDPLDASIVLSRRERANLELFRGNLDGAIEGLTELIRDCHELPSSQDSILAMCYNSLGHAYLQNGEFTNAKSTYETARNIRLRVLPPDHIEIGYSENAMGMVYGYLDRLDSSLMYYLKAESIFENNLPEGHPNIIQIRTNIGINYADMGQFWEALSYHKKNLKYIESLAPLPRIGVLANLASMLTMVRDYEDALIYLAEVETILDAYPDIDPGMEAYVADERSRIYRDLDEYELARLYIDQTIEIMNEQYGRTHPRLISIYIRKGLLLAWFERYKEAERAYENAWEIATNNSEVQSVQKGNVLEYWGELLVEQRKSRNAIEVLDRAILHYQHSNSKWNLTGTYLKKSLALRENQQWAESKENLENAWKNLIPDTPFGENVTEQARRYWRELDTKDLLEIIGQFYHQQFGRTNDLKDLQSALEFYESAIAVVDSQRYFYWTEGSKLAAVQYQLPLFEAAISISCELFLITKDQQYAKQGFLLSEKSKATTLIDQLRNMEALHFGGIPDSLIHQEQEFRQRLASFNPRRNELLEDQHESTSIEDPNQLLIQQYRNFLYRIEQEYPKYFALKYTDHTLSTTQILDRLQDDQAMYSYFWGEQDQYVMKLFQGNVTIKRISKDQDIEKELNQWVRYISLPPLQHNEIPETIARSGQKLFETLLVDCDEEIKQIVIIPNGKLGYLPFESLLMNIPKSLSFRQLSYVGREHAITYAYAARIWLQHQTSPIKEMNAYLGVAPSFQGATYQVRDQDLGELKFNQSEVSEVAQLLGGKALTGNLATEGSLKQLSENQLILHFATHALADEENMMDSRLYFHQDEDTTEDGILYAHEIYGLRFNSPLTVLSACRTGSGPVQKGEGVMSLARAFQYAGSQRVLTTLWQIDDQAASTLGILFFRYLSQGIPVSDAMQKARAEWLTQSDSYHCHPYFWSGYILIGEGGTILPKQNPSFHWILIGCMIGLLGVLSWMKLRAKRRQK